ncbi:MAG: glycosyltransferase family 4 protein [Planctomycetota bacterium]
MKIGIVQQFVDTRRGGAETSTVEMARCLAQLGHDVTVICRGPLFPREPYVREGFEGGHATQAVGFEPFIEDDIVFRPLAIHARTKLGRTYGFVRAADRFCRYERFDIVHAVTPCLSADVYQPRGGTYAETIARGLARSRSPVVRALRRLGRRFNLSQRFLYWIEQTLLIKHQPWVWVAAVSEYVRRQVLQIGEFPPERVRVVFNGVETGPLALSYEQRAEWRRRLRGELQVADDGPLILFMAHNFRLKGLGELIRAVAGVRERGADATAWTVAVAGRDRAGPFVRLARRLGVEGRIRFVGTEHPAQAWYAAADVLVHPTWYDPCSRVVLEALSVGLPVVTSMHNGASEVMVPGRHGAVIDDPADAESLAAAIDRSLRPEVRAACAADAPRMAERLSMARHARELVALYEEVRACRLG